MERYLISEGPPPNTLDKVPAVFGLQTKKELGLPWQTFVLCFFQIDRKQRGF